MQKTVWRVEFYMNGRWNHYQDYDDWQTACYALTWLQANGNKARKTAMRGQPQDDR